MSDLKDCPQCGVPATKALYAGFPMWLCSDMTCGCVFGMCAFVMEWLPFNGVFVRYDSYWSGLWHLIACRKDDL